MYRIDIGDLEITKKLKVCDA